MTAKTFKPLPELKSLWHLINLISFIFLLIVPVLLFSVGAELWLSVGMFILLFILLVCFTFYIPAFYNSLEYSVDAEGVRLKKGVFWKKRTTVPYQKITNIDITQSPVERMFQLSKLHLQTAGSSGSEGSKAELVISGIRDCETLKDYIMGKIAKPGAEPIPVTKSKAEPDTLKAILDEVSAIRKALENKS